LIYFLLQFLNTLSSASLFLVILGSVITLNFVGAYTSDGTVKSFEMISLNEGGFEELVAKNDQFGFSAAKFMTLLCHENF